MSIVMASGTSAYLAISRSHVIKASSSTTAYSVQQHLIGQPSPFYVGLCREKGKCRID